jgi:hypothetical protein
MNRRSLAWALDKTEAGSYIFERFAYRSLDKLPKQTRGQIAATVGKGTRHIGHGFVWQSTRCGNDGARYVDRGEWPPLPGGTWR